MANQPLVLYHVEYRQRRPRRNRVAPESTEHPAREGEPLDQLPPGHNGGNRIAVAHRLAERDQVGLDTEVRECPEVFAASPMPDLHLIGHEQPTRLSRGARERLRPLR